MRDVCFVYEELKEEKEYCSTILCAFVCCSVYVFQRQFFLHFLFFVFVKWDEVRLLLLAQTSYIHMWIPNEPTTMWIRVWHIIFVDLYRNNISQTTLYRGLRSAACPTDIKLLKIVQMYRTYYIPGMSTTNIVSNEDFIRLISILLLSSITF